MTDVSIDFIDPIDVPSTQLKGNIPGFLQFPREIPDPKEWISKQRQQVRPWLTFIQTSNFKTAQSITRLGKRIMKNIEYFQANYLFVFLGLIVYCLITSPLILVALSVTFYVGYRLNKRSTEKKVSIFGKELTIAQQYGLLALCSLPIYYLVGAHGAMFWVIGASMVLITLHAAFYNIDALVNDEDDLQQLLEEV